MMEYEINEEEYKEIMSRLRIGVDILYDEKIIKITDIIHCRYSKNGNAVLKLCQYCPGRIVFKSKEEGTCTYIYDRDITKMFFRIIEEDFLTEKDFEI